VGSEVAVFEPTHGSAPKYEKLSPSIVNPIAMFMTACMMLDHIGEQEMSKRIFKAIEDVIAEGKTRTYDMMMIKGGPDVLSQGAASTDQITDAICERL
jgi:3-isopropylmalate dehydrogenase